LWWFCGCAVCQAADGYPDHHGFTDALINLPAGGGDTLSDVYGFIDAARADQHTDPHRNRPGYRNTDAHRNGHGHADTDIQ
jgi:hypothetical protein